MIYITEKVNHFCNPGYGYAVILLSNQFHSQMEKKTNAKKVKLCKRCKKNISEDLVCTSCKVELLNKYDSKIDWRTAFDIERVQQSAMRYMEDDL